MRLRETEKIVIISGRHKNSWCFLFLLCKHVFNCMRKRVFFIFRKKSDVKFNFSLMLNVERRRSDVQAKRSRVQEAPQKIRSEKVAKKNGVYVSFL